MLSLSSQTNMDQTIFKNISNEIMRECNNKGIKVTEKFITYFLDLLLLNPSWKISLNDLELDRSHLQALVKHAYTTLENSEAPSVVCLKMQMYFQCSYEGDDTIVFTHREKLMAQLLPLQKAILKITGANGDDQEKLFKYVINFITLLEGLGNPAIEQVYTIADNALRSIFNEEETLLFFEEENEVHKLDMLLNLSNLVAGIRLFHAKVIKPDPGIENLQPLLLKASHQMREELHAALVEILEKVNVMTTALDVIYVVKKSKEDEFSLELHVPEYHKNSFYIERMKDLLALYRQFELFIRRLLEDLISIENKFEVVFQQYETAIADLYHTVKNKTMIPITIIYPKFTLIANIWRVLQNDVIYLTHMHAIKNHLCTYAEQTVYYEDLWRQLIGKNPILTDETRLEDTGLYRVAVLGCKHTKILDHKRIPNFERQPLELLGFCIWKFVESQGALIPANPKNGIIEIEKRYYAFSCLEGILAFAKDPERYINRTLNFVRAKPELIHFLRLYEQLDAKKTIEQLVPPVIEIRPTAEHGVQTMLHPKPPTIDHHYLWNVWDWKRKALTLANVSNKKSKATQTYASGHRGSVKLQTNLIRDHGCQTKKDAYTNVPTQSTFIYGLRGRKDDKQFILTLTRPVEE